MQLSKTMLWLATLLWFVLGAWWYSNSDCSSCGAAATPNNNPSSAVQALPPLSGFSVADGAWSAGSSTNLKFGASGFAPLYDAEIAANLDSIVAYSKSNSSKTVHITGSYGSTEKNSTQFADLGLARADAIKQILVTKGLPASSITTSSIMKDDLVFAPADTLVGGIAIQFATNAIGAATTAAANVPATDLFGPYTVYFKTGSKDLDIDAAFKDYLNKANAYLKTNPDKKLMVTGHTDNVGATAANKTLSENRAAFVKNVLGKQGIITIDKILSSGKGIEEPIADNTTAAGRAKNRRVTIQLQQ